MSSEPIKSYLILFLIFLAVVIFQKSFFSNFRILGAALNLILVLVFLFNFFEYRNCIFAGFLGGALLDIFSIFPIGTFFLTLGILSILMKKFSNLFQKENIFGFSLIFLFYFSFYKILSPFFAKVLDFIFFRNFNFLFNFDLKIFFLEFLFNFALAGVCFLFFKKYEYLFKKQKS